MTDCKWGVYAVVTRVKDGLAYVYTVNCDVDPIMDLRRASTEQLVRVGDWVRANIEKNLVVWHEKVPHKLETRVDGDGRVRIKTTVSFVTSNDGQTMCLSDDVGPVLCDSVPPARTPGVVYSAWLVNISDVNKVGKLSKIKWSLPMQRLVPITSEFPVRKSGTIQQPTGTLDKVQLEVFEGVVVCDYDDSCFLIYICNKKWTVLCPKGSNLWLGQVISFRLKQALHVKRTENGDIMFAADGIKVLGSFNKVEHLTDGIRVNCYARVEPGLSRFKKSLVVDMLGEVEDPEGKLLTKMVTREITFWARWRRSEPSLWAVDEVLTVGGEPLAKFSETNFVNSDGIEEIKDALGMVCGMCSNESCAYVWSLGITEDSMIYLSDFLSTPKVGDWVEFGARFDNFKQRFRNIGKVRKVEEHPTVKMVDVKKGKETYSFPEVLTNVIDIGESFAAVDARKGPYRTDFNKKFSRVFSENLGYILDTERRLPRGCRGTLEAPLHYTIWVVRIPCTSGCSWKVARESDYIVRNVSNSDYLARMAKNKKFIPYEEPHKDEDSHKRHRSQADDADVASSSVDMSRFSVGAETNKYAPAFHNRQYATQLQPSAATEKSTVARHNALLPEEDDLGTATAQLLTELLSIKEVEDAVAENCSKDFDAVITYLSQV